MVTRHRTLRKKRGFSPALNRANPPPPMLALGAALLLRKLTHPHLRPYSPRLMNLIPRVQIAVQVVTAAQNQLPATVRAVAREVPVCYESRPHLALIADGLDTDLLGLFVGDEHGAELGEAQPLPPQILLFLDNIWDLAEADEANYRAEVRLTYLHELGHDLGWDEEEIAQRGLE